MQENLPLVSIVIPYYNHDRFIEACLNALIADPYPSKEILIINDGSTERNATALTSWVEGHPEVTCTLIERENRGVSATLNELIGLAKGTYILPCASDDLLLPNTLGARIKVLEEHPETPVLIGDCIVINDAGDLLHESSFEHLFGAHRANYFTASGILEEMVQRWALAGPSTLYHRSAFSKLGLFDTQLQVEDWDFFLRAALAKKVRFFELPVGAYRLHGSNTSQNINTYRDLARTALRYWWRLPFPLNLQLLKRGISYARAAQ